MKTGSVPFDSDDERAIFQRLKDDFPHYASRCLRIRSKAGEIKPLTLNVAQLYIHQRIEEQLAKTGRVRAVVLKGRQQGCSTYVEGRFYWKVTHRFGVRAFILTHEQDASDNLFEMAERYHEHCPDLVKPSTGAANAKELHFDKLDSGYKVGTAGSKAVGRSQTLQLFHGSEVAYWPFAETHAAGILQAVPDEPGTEIILESTANGPGDFFHRRWQSAVRGEGGYIAIFVPWYWQPEYRAHVPEGSQRTPEEQKYAEVCGGLDDAQVIWRRDKIAQLGGDDIGLEQFRREYPANPDEAFQATARQGVIPSASVRSAIGREVKATGKLVWGLDVARFGDDSCALAKRKGNVLQEPIEEWVKLDTMQTAGKVKVAYDEAEDKPESIFVDVIGIGAGVVDRLRELRLPAIGVNVAEGSSDDERYLRLRDELWFRGREWFEAKDCSIPADEATVGELTGVQFTYTSGGKAQVESKDSMKKRGLRSPNRADAFLLTFASGGGRETQAVYMPPADWDT